MGGELLIFCAWLTSVIKVIFLYMLNTGTNLALVKFVMGNILILTLVTLLTKTKKDDTLLQKIKDMISNFKNKGEESKDEKIK